MPLELDENSENRCSVANIPDEPPPVPELKKLSFSSKESLPRQSVTVDPSFECVKVSEKKTEFVKVFLRIRPKDERRRTRRYKRTDDTSENFDPELETIVPLNNRQVEVIPPAGSHAARNFESNGSMRFKFSRVFDQNADQVEIYNSTCENLVQGLVNGKDGLLFAYGVTNAGKTYTVEGNRSNPGILPQALNRLFELVSGTSNLTVSVSYLQVYNEELHDLQVLSANNKRAYDKAKVNIKFINNRVVVNGLSVTEIKSASDGMRILRKGRKLRTTHETDLNLSSSRSHSVFCIHVSNNLSQVEGRLHIVDLAGTERGKRTNPTKARQKEANNINSSLMNLMTCLDTIRYNQRQKKLKHGNEKMVPFRLSKLTLLFRDVFLKNNTSGVAMIVNCSTMTEDFSETVHALKYGALVSEVKLKPPKFPIEVNDGSNSQATSGISYDQNGRMVVTQPTPSRKPDGSQVDTERSMRLKGFEEYLNEEETISGCPEVADVHSLGQAALSKAMINYYSERLETQKREHERSLRFLKQCHALALQQERQEAIQSVYNDPSKVVMSKKKYDYLKHNSEAAEAEALALRQEERLLKEKPSEGTIAPDQVEDELVQVVSELKQQLEQARQELSNLKATQLGAEKQTVALKAEHEQLLETLSQEQAQRRMLKRQLKQAQAEVQLVTNKRQSKRKNSDAQCSAITDKKLKTSCSLPVETDTESVRDGTKKGLLSRVYDKLTHSKQSSKPTPIARRTRASKRNKQLSVMM